MKVSRMSEALSSKLESVAAEGAWTLAASRDARGVAGSGSSHRKRALQNRLLPSR